MTAEHAHGIDTGGEGPTFRGPGIPGRWEPDEPVEPDSLATLNAHAGTAYSNNETRCRCDGRWRTHAEHRAHLAEALTATRASAADAVLAEARRLCCGENPAAHHAASAKHSELMAFAGRLAEAVRGR